MLDPTFRASTAHIVQFRSIGAERITDSPPQLANRSREFTAHDTLPLPLTYDATVSGRYSEVLHLRIGAPGSQQMCAMPASVAATNGCS